MGQLLTLTRAMTIRRFPSESESESDSELEGNLHQPRRAETLPLSGLSVLISLGYI